MITILSGSPLTRKASASLSSSTVVLSSRPIIFTVASTLYTVTVIGVSVSLSDEPPLPPLPPLQWVDPDMPSPKFWQLVAILEMAA